MEKKLALHELINKPVHWCPRSEKYSGVDSLLSALMEGWELNRRVFRHETRLRPPRPIVVYYFELTRDSQTATMAVVSNPQIDKIIAHYRLHVITHTFFERVEVETVEAPAVETETVEARVVKPKIARIS